MNTYRPFFPDEKDSYNIQSNSGGATRFIGIMEADMQCHELGFRPDIILGISAGAIGGIPRAMGMFDEIREQGYSLTPDKFFDKSPFGKKGNPKVSALLRVAFGANSLGIQNVQPILEEVITEDVWKEYINGDYPMVFVGAVNFETGGRRLWNLKDPRITRQMAFDRIMASSRIPIITQAQKVTELDGSSAYYYDGGVRDHNIAAYFLQKFPKLKVNQLVSVYSRPKNHVVIDKNWAKNLITVIDRTIKVMTIEISKGDEEVEKSICKERGIDHRMIFLPDTLSSMYSTNKKELEQLGLQAKMLAIEAYKYNH